ncbi:MAG: NAD-dependent deacetylase [Planctomycetota bacterium]
MMHDEAPTADALPPLPESLLKQLATVRSVGVITGAGISAESGIRTYRGSGGVYDDPEEGDRTIEALTGSTLIADPDRTWRTLAALASQALTAEPNAGHHALVEIERKVHRFVLLTQNVDGLHRAAGSTNMIEIHGHLLDTLCLACGKEDTFTREQVAALTATPRCECGAGLRPRVVLFDEMLDHRKVRQLQRELIEQPPDLVLAVGTTGLFPYIAAPMVEAARARHLTVEVNPEVTMLTRWARFHLPGGAGHYLPLIAAAIPGSPR